MIINIQSIVGNGSSNSHSGRDNKDIKIIGKGTQRAISSASKKGMLLSGAAGSTSYCVCRLQKKAST